ncbi:MAG: hypothetical protein ACK5X5_20595 [bacterium]|nr:hypothetical protein [Rhodocyclaceae bacterium]MCE2979232.1 hypothetical protein [Betaproteobacteria bacterium]
MSKLDAYEREVLGTPEAGQLNMDSRLPASPAPIADGEELRRWLKSHP